MHLSTALSLYSRHSFSFPFSIFVISCFNLITYDRYSLICCTMSLSFLSSANHHMIFFNMFQYCIKWIESFCSTMYTMSNIFIGISHDNCILPLDILLLRLADRAQSRSVPLSPQGPHKPNRRAQSRWWRFLRGSRNSETRRNARRWRTLRS